MFSVRGLSGAAFGKPIGGTLRRVGQLTPAQSAGEHQHFFGCFLASFAPAQLALVGLLVASLMVALSGCGRDKSPGLGKRVIPLGQKVPKGGGRYHVGKPYDIAGTRYYPREDPSYDRTGQASWYGELFQGRHTANGEIYDMDRLSAAHPTLPLPVYAHVTNLQNGRSLIVRVNDRGPFKKDRVIDLSRRSAEILGFRSRGTAPVRVRYLRRAPLSGDDRYERQYLADRGYRRYASKPVDGAPSPEQNPIAVASLPGRNGPPPLPDRSPRLKAIAAVSAPAPASASQPAMAAWKTELKGADETTGSTGPVLRASPSLVAPPQSPAILEPAIRGPAIQAGSFRNRENAERARVLLAGVARVNVDEVKVEDQTYFRVWIGPFRDGIAAAAALPQVTEAGYRGAKIILRN